MTVGMCGGINTRLIIAEGTKINVTLNKADQITKSHCKSFSYQVKSNTTTTTEGKITIEASGSLQLKGSILTINLLHYYLVLLVLNLTN